MMLGANLCSLFDISLQGPFGRTYPEYSVYGLRSRLTLEVMPKPLPNEIRLLLPAEKFLAEEITRNAGTDPKFNVKLDRVVCETHLVLLMSPKTQASLAGSKPSTLLDYVRVCEATNSQPDPVRFTMADPDTCSSSWLALAAMLEDQFHTTGQRLAEVPPHDLESAVTDLRNHIVVQGVSDRLEMYRYVLGGCPDNQVLMVYGHLAELLSATGAFNGYVVVAPKLPFKPMVQALVLTRREDKIDTEAYVLVLLKHFDDALLPSMKLTPPNATAPGLSDAAPDYATMTRLLDLWDGGEGGKARNAEFQ